MIVTAIKQADGLFIPYEQLKRILKQEFTKIMLDIKVIEYKNDIINESSGLLNNYNIDAVDFQNTIRDEWNENI